MNLDEQIANAAARAAVAARNGDDDAWREWSDRATRLLDQRDSWPPEISEHEAARLLAAPKPPRFVRPAGCAPVSFYARPAS